MPGIANIQIIVSEDGSHTLYLPELDETYHSIHGAIQESSYVYIQQGLEKLAAKSEISILEVGFGTGLNCLLTALYVKDSAQKIFYHAIEPFPLLQEVYSKINYPKDELQSDLFHKIHGCKWGAPIDLQEGFRLTKNQCTLQKIALKNNKYDLIYYDAFAPSKQPEMWLVEPLQIVYDSMRTDGLLVTYCAQGQFKRNLKSIGFQVDTFPGPPGKFEIVRATKPSKSS